MHREWARLNYLQRQGTPELEFFDGNVPSPKLPVLWAIEAELDQATFAKMFGMSPR